MYKLTIFVLLLFAFTSCSDRLAQCEEKLQSLIDNQIVPVDLPDPEPKPVTHEVVVVRVTEKESYIIDEEEYTLDELDEILKSKVEDSGESKVKIDADPSSLYRPVFRLLVVLRAQHLEPILKYSE